MEEIKIGEDFKEKLLQSKIDAGIYKNKNIKIINGQVKLVTYDYDSKTGQFAGESFADESPLEPGKFHVPANSTEIEPLPVKDKFIRVFKFGTWSYADDISHEDFGATPEMLAASIRSQRDAILSRCDYTQLPDFSGDSKVWAKYRQSLRDITKQKTFPQSVDWPAEPK